MAFTDFENPYPTSLQNNFLQYWKNSLVKNVEQKVAVSETENMRNLYQK